MHEYTLDEGELKRCENIKDYFALYKVYKKSGLGPKNGEQYGALFREEDWADDEGTSNPVPVDTETPVKQPIEVTSDNNVIAKFQVEPPLIDVQEFITNRAPVAALPEPQGGDYHYTLPQVVGEEENQSALLDSTSREVVLPEQMRVIASSYQLNDEHSSFDFTQTPTCKLQSNESLEVTSASNHFECAPQIEEDFLEINDLVFPEDTVSSVENPIENPIENMQYDELDMYYDAAMFLHDLGPINQGNALHPYLNAFGDNNFINQEYQLQANSNLSLVDQHLQPQSTIYHAGDQLQFQAVGNQMDYPAHNDPVGMHQINSQLWTHDQGSDVFNPAASNLETVSMPTSGLKCDVNQDQGNKEDATTSTFSSALWAFVESIPTTPASAAETPLVSRAFERMSSFSRVRLNPRNGNVSAGNVSETGRGMGGKRGFFFLSVLGALCAILWVLIGTVRVVGRSISS